MSRKHSRQKDVSDVASDIRSKQIIAEHEDLKKRFGEYDDDLSVGGMYARKKKSTKPKSKRKPIKKPLKKLVSFFGQGKGNKKRAEDMLTAIY